jgi:heparinase II/III-like protein
MNGLSLIRTLGDIGIRSIAWRAYYEFTRKSGWLKHRYPHSSVRTWNTFDVDPIVDRVQKGTGFFIPPNTLSFRSAYQDLFPELASVLARAADRIGSGEIEYFSKLPYKFDSLPDWRRNPFTGESISDEKHWSDLKFYSPRYGDLKFMLEPSRFSFLCVLVRAYRYTGDEKYPAVFWRLFEDWIAKNPPQSGPLWICGQESALRIIAWCFALYGFGASSTLTVERAAKLIAVITAHADRIQGTIAYARSQKNNHSLSEAVGLWTVGLLFPEVEQADDWRDHGRRLLEEEAQRQIYDDGSYVQHSVNYHRLMLHLLLWGIRLGEANGQSLSRELYRKFDVATQFLYQITDVETGLAPNYGANDGALLLRLNQCDYTDFRPALQASHYLVHKQVLFARGPWDEDLLWFFGLAPVERELAQISGLRGDVGGSGDVAIEASFASFPVGGYYVIRGQNSWAFVRCARYKDRPGQADQLHFDLWWRGSNIACDAGSYLYNSEPPWDNGLAVTSVHNTVTVDGRDQMKRGGRFLWLDWAQGALRFQGHSENAQLDYWEGEHDGYHRLKPPVRHRRAIVRMGDHWLVLDRLTSTAEHEYRLHWLLMDAPYRWDEGEKRLRLNTPEGSYCVQIASLSKESVSTVVRADESSPRGWRAPYYNYREAALSLDLKTRANSVQFWTVLGPEPCEITANGDGLRLVGNGWQARTSLAMDDSGGSLVRSVRLFGATQDELEIV